MRRRARGAKPSRKRRRRRQERTRVLIVCEGRETERNYFDQLKREDIVAERFTVTVKKGSGGTREQIAGNAVDRKGDSPDEYDEVWCVMDIEDSSHRGSLIKALKRLRENEIEACLSNPSFEVWYLAHFERTAKAFSGCNAVVLALNTHWKKQFNREYDKSDKSNYRRISNWTSKAIEHAQWVRETHHTESTETCDCNSSTEVYRLVRRLTTGEE
ncbi:MAG: RloB family protein [Planctomycetaceae bacterium]